MKFLPYNLLLCFSLAGLTLFTNGCQELGPSHMQPLTITPISISLPENKQPIALCFYGPIPDKPLSETVWNSKSGPSANLEDSHQIGFVQDYNELVGIASCESILFIPFGRMFEEIFESGLKDVFTNAVVVNDNETKALLTNSTAKVSHVVKITVKDFSVWEKPLNHINMKATVDCAVFNTGKTIIPEFSCEAHVEAKEQPVGYFHMTSGPIIDKMAKVSNDMAADLSKDILEKMQKQIGQ